MGKKNPLKQIVQASGNILFNPAREAARAVGADGVVKFFDQGKKVHNDIGNGVIDLANDEKGKQQKKADAANAESERIAKEQGAAASARQAAADYQASEAERMGAGSASRTLLTGPAGLDDEDEKSITRRTLQAR